MAIPANVKYIFKCYLLIGNILLFCVFCSKENEFDSAKPATIELSSSAFDHEGNIPKTYTCDGKDHSPPLQWQNVPENTASYVITLSDPTAPHPMIPFVTIDHWVVFNIDREIRSIPENWDAQTEGSYTRGYLSYFETNRYRGPCPKMGRHRYNFHIYALDRTIEPKPDVEREELLKLIRPYVLATGKFSGFYARN